MWWFKLIVTLAFIAGCFPVLAESENPCKGQQNRFYIDADGKGNHGEWTNFMPENAGSMIKLNMVDRTRPLSGTTSVRVDVKLQPPGWAGVAVASLPDYWGETPSEMAFDWSKAKRLNLDDIYAVME